MTAPHAEGEHWVAQEGPFSAATSNVPVLHYFPARGRAEPIRLTLALVRQPWFEPPAGPLAAVVRKQLDSYPFRQMPRYVEEGNVDLVQSMAILRHLGRKYKLYGSDLEEAAAVDVIIEAVADLRAKLKAVWCGSGLSADAVAAYLASVLAPEEQLMASNEPGPGLACLERFLSGPRRQWPASCDEPRPAAAEAAQQGCGDCGASSRPTTSSAAAAAAAAGGDVEAWHQEGRSSGGGGDHDGDDDGDEGRLWLVGDRISIADIAVADLVDMHLSAPQLEGAVKQNFPQLILLRRRVMGQPGIKEYLSSNNRHDLLWGQDWKQPRDSEVAKMET